MHGHHELIAMRRAGMKPEMVWIADYSVATDWAKWGDHPQVCVAGDTPEIEDFRFLVGITAIVNGFDSARVDRIANACAAHAKRVIATTAAWATAHQVETVRITDTEGVLTWPV